MRRMSNQWRKTKQNFESLIQNQNALGAVPENTGFHENQSPSVLKLANQLLNSLSVLVFAKPPISIRSNLLVCDKTACKNHMRRLVQTSQPGIQKSSMPWTEGLQKPCTDTAIFSKSWTEWLLIYFFFTGLYKAEKQWL